MKFNKVGMLVKDVRFKTETVDDEERKVVVLALEIAPLGKKLAEALAPGVVAKVFNGDAKPDVDFAGVEVKLHGELMSVQIRKTPDSEASVEIVDVELGKTLKLKADNDADRYVGALTASFRYPAAKDLLTLANAVGTQVFISAQTQQGSLLGEA